MKNKLLAIFLIFFLISPVVSADDQTFDYEHLIAGSCVTQDGFFFTEQGMVNLVVNTREKIRIATLDGQRQIDLLKVDLHKCSESKELELRIQREMFEKQLQIKQSAIDAYKTEIFWDNIKIVGGIVIGVGTGIIIGILLPR
jgi:hypothetical protein